MADITNQQLLEALTAQLGVITDQMVTKDDLKRELERFVTKDDLKRELERFPTKDDLNNVSNRLDGVSIRVDTISTRMARLERKFDSYQASNIKHHLETRKMIGDLDRRFGNLQEGLARAASAI